MNKHFLQFFALFLITVSASAQKKITVKSPDGQLAFTFVETPAAPTYQVSYHNQPIVNSSTLGLNFKDGGEFSQSISASKAKISKVDETYKLPVGKASSVRNHYNQAIIPLKEKNGQKRLLNLVVRVFDDGLGFRYEIPKEDNWTSYELTDENTTFNLTGNPTVLTLFRKNYTTSHEGYYTRLPYGELKADSLMDMPTLFEYPGKIYMAITEAALRDYAGMYLAKTNGHLVSKLSPLPKGKGVKVKAVLPHKTPWRVMLLGKTAGQLLESNIITSLNEPPAFSDFSWLNPGKTTFHWLNGDIIPDTTIIPGKNFEFNKYYIDFCAANGIEYHSIIGFGGSAWYQNTSKSYAPGSDADVTIQSPGIDVRKIADYAESKGVKIRAWVHWKPFYAKLDTALSLFEKWGIKGLMVDFLDRDDQEMVNIQEEILKKSAAHHIHIQFHGAYKPTGLSRTYPNEFTREGTYNYENNKWAGPVDADHDLNIAFTRLLAGAADYHLGGFRAVPVSKFKSQYTRPLVVGTRAHMLGMYVVMESYIGMVCDYPEAYSGQKGFDFVRKIPTVWDETKVPGAELGEYVAIARRSGSDWYLGTINSTKAKTVPVKLDFLPAGTFEATIYKDAPDSEVNGNSILIEKKIVTSKDMLQMNMASGGGQAVIFTKK